MQLSITGKQIDIGNSLRTYVQDKVDAIGRQVFRPAG